MDKLDAAPEATNNTEKQNFQIENKLEVSKYLVPVNEHNLSRLSSIMGAASMDFLKEKGMQIYTPDYKIANIDPPENETHFYIPHELWVFKIKIDRPGSEGENKSIDLSFGFKENIAVELKSMLEERTLGDILKKKFSKGDEYKQIKEDLQPQTLPFLLTFRNFVKKIDTDCKINIEAAGKRRETLYKKALKGVPNTYIYTLLHYGK